MGLYIKNLKMPQNCDECPLNSTCGYSLHMPLYHTEKRHDDCPLIEVPEPHGRLIDADALNYSMLYKENWMRGTGIEAPAVWRKDIDAAPTIIPASGENE